MELKGAESVLRLELLSPERAPGDVSQGLPGWLQRAARAE